MPQIDPILKEFILKQCNNNKALINRKQKIVCKVYIMCKLSFLAVPIFTPASVISICLSIYKTFNNETFQNTTAFITKMTGLIYTFPSYLFDYNALSHMEKEKAVFSAAVLIFPYAKFRIIFNETHEDYEIIRVV
jgi:hypothetical protein